MNIPQSETSTQTLCANIIGLADLFYGSGAVYCEGSTLSSLTISSYPSSCLTHV